MILLLLRFSNQSHGSNAQSSAFLYACNTHCHQFSRDDRWGRLSIQGESLRTAFTRWLHTLLLRHGGDHTHMGGRMGIPGSGGVAQPAVDCDGLGCNPTCCDTADDDDGPVIT